MLQLRRNWGECSLRGWWYYCRSSSLEEPLLWQLCFYHSASYWCKCWKMCYHDLYSFLFDISRYSKEMIQIKNYYGTERYQLCSQSRKPCRYVADWRFKRLHCDEENITCKCGSTIASHWWLRSMQSRTYFGLDIAKSISASPVFGFSLHRKSNRIILFKNVRLRSLFLWMAWGSYPLSPTDPSSLLLLSPATSAWCAGRLHEMIHSVHSFEVKIDILILCHILF